MIIVTLTKNSSATIDSTIESIKIQKFKDLVWYVIDGGSKDDTLNKVKKSNLDFKIINLQSKGIFKAYNVILDHFRVIELNDVIFFLHSDDLLYSSSTLSKVNKVFANHNVDALFGNIVYFKNNQKNYFRKWKSENIKKQIQINGNLHKLKKIKKNDLIFGWSFPHSSFFFHSKVLGKLPKYYENFDTSSDYAWSIEILLQNNLDIYYLDENIIKMRAGGISTKISNIAKQGKTDFLLIKKIFYRKFRDIFFCIIVLFSKKIRKLKQFL